VPNCDLARPSQRSPIPNFYLAGARPPIQPGPPRACREASSLDFFILHAAWPSWETPPLSSLCFARHTGREGSLFSAMQRTSMRSAADARCRPARRRLHEAALPGQHGGRRLLRQAGRAGHRAGAPGLTCGGAPAQARAPLLCCLLLVGRPHMQLATESTVHCMRRGLQCMREHGHVPVCCSGHTVCTHPCVHTGFGIPLPQC